jgi:uracil-DNA glycosylase family 4
MSERDELLRNLKALVELDRGLGVEFMARIPLATTPAAAPVPIRVGSPTPAAATGHRPQATDIPRAALASSPTPDTRRQTPDVIPAPTGLPAADLAAIAAQIATCQRCKLCQGRTNTVPGEGNPAAELLFVGEGPGADEDAQGRPFVGAAGQLLDKMIVAMGLRRDEVFIANVLKCRPPGNRTPEPDEVAACMPYLRQQIATLRPKVICSLGNTPLRALMGDDSLGITRQRGKQLDFAGIPVIPTFHPSYLLRNETAKKPCWEDLQVVLKLLGRTAPKRS